LNNENLTRSGITQLFTHAVVLFVFVLFTSQVLYIPIAIRRSYR